MMLPVRDSQVRLVLLNHIAVRLGEGDPADVHASGIDAAQLGRLLELSAVDLSRLAAMRALSIEVAIDSGGLKAGLRAVARVKAAQALETYFIRHGASWQMMNTLFKMGRNVTLKRRRNCGAWRPAGRFPLPDPRTRERVYRSWRAIQESDARSRYYRLHHVFPHFSIAVLEAVVREFEVER